jgi:pilus assembly protein Flp/PilA
MKRWLREFWYMEGAATVAEYALILAVIGSAFAVAALYLGGAIATAMNDTGTCIQDKTDC